MVSLNAMTDPSCISSSWKNRSKTNPSMVRFRHSTMFLDRTTGPNGNYACNC